MGGSAGWPEKKFPSKRRHFAVIGSRNFPAPEVVRGYVAGLPSDCIVVSGAAAGVDTWAEEAAEAAGIVTLIFHADWEGLGQRAGPIRNEQIIAAAGEIVAFWNGKSRGTLNALSLAKKKGIATTIFDEAGKPVPFEVALQAAQELGVVDALEVARHRLSGKS